MPTWVVVATYPGRFVAEMMAELLRNEGVEAIVAVDDAGGLRPDLALTLGARVRVRPEDEQHAREILAHLGRPEDL